MSTDTTTAPAPKAKKSVALSGTDFQLAVWRALAEVPAGQVISYAMLADMIGRPRALRASGPFWACCLKRTRTLTC